jgi:hypothetical protein
MDGSDAIAPSAERSGTRRERVGKVVANAGRDILIMIESHGGVRPSLRIGDIVVIAGEGPSTVGTVSGMNVPAPGLESDGAAIWIAQVELNGTLRPGPEAPALAQSIPWPPALGDVAFLASAADLRRLFRNGDEAAYPIGTILGQKDVAATIDGDAMIAGGFAILGATGSGKSSTMASLVRALLRHRHEAALLLIDPYNEYSRSFGRAANCIAPEPGMFPHWILSFEELVWVLSCNGGALDPEECSILEEAVLAARLRFVQRNARPRDQGGTGGEAVSVEGPIPYRVTDIISFIDRHAATDDMRSSAAFKRLRTRVTAALGDPRLSIIFGNASVTDSLPDLVERLFHIERQGPPLTVLQLGQLSASVDKLVVSIVARLAAAVAEWGSAQRHAALLIEDASRYAAADPADRIGELSRAALRQLGGRPRKLGTTLGLVASNPRSLSRDILAQCATFFVHRMPSPTDVATLEDILPDAADGFLTGVSNLGPGEAIGVGRALPLTSRLALAPLPEAAIPSEHPRSAGEDASYHATAIVHRWRYSGTVDWTDTAPPPAVSPAA